MTDQPIQVTLSDDIGMVSQAPDPSSEPPAPRKGEEPAPQPEDSAVAPPEDKPDPVKKPDPPKPASAPVPDPRERSRPDKPATNSSKSNNRSAKPIDTSGFHVDTSGPANQPSPGTGQRSQASATGQDQANFLSAVKKQVQPCADRQNIPATEAESIVAVVQLSLKPDGSLQSIQILRHSGVTDENRRYVTRVDDAVEAIFRGCTPIRGLPAALYDVPRGWKTLKFNYQMGN